MRGRAKAPKLEARCYVEHVDDTTDAVICEAVVELKRTTYFGGGVFMLVPRHHGPRNYDAANAALREWFAKATYGRLVAFADLSEQGHVSRRHRTHWMCSGRRVVAVPPPQWSNGT